MKPKILKISTILLIFTLNFSCDVLKTEGDYPGVSIYKTKGDYFNLVDIGMKGDEIYRTCSFWNPRYNSLTKMIIRDNDTIYSFRCKLVNGYVLDAEADENTDVFISMTNKDHLVWQIANEIGAIPHDTLRKYILDKAPYIEFYRNRTDVKRLYMEDSLEINEIIKNGEIDKYFEKLK